MGAPPDPIPIADDLCEILHGTSSRAPIGPILHAAGAAVTGALVEVARRGFLPGLVAALDSGGWSQVVLDARSAGVLPALFAVLIDNGQYDALVARLGRPADAAVLPALAAARPDYGQDALNAAAQSAVRADTEYGALIVPGYTPLDARAPVAVADNPAARARLDAARADLDRFVAPVIIVSGGRVHPPGTPIVEALDMRSYLVANGVPDARILVDPYARHSTTNLRNAARLMLALGIARGLIVTGFESEPFDQAFYFAHPIISTFQQRCRAELGYLVGDLAPVDDHRVSFVPAADCQRADARDPLDV